MRARVKTSQIYFQQAETCDNAVVVKLFFDPKKVREHFELASGTESVNYGFCTLVLHDRHAEFVTEMRFLRRTIAAVRAYMKRKYSVVNAHTKAAVALLELRGVQTMGRQIAMGRIAQKAECSVYQSYGVQSWSL